MFKKLKELYDYREIESSADVYFFRYKTLILQSFYKLRQFTVRFRSAII